MTPNNVVDDYYSSLNHSASDAEASSGEKKPKLKARKLIKKVEPIENKVVQEEKKSGADLEVEKKALIIKKKKIVQKMEVVREEKPRFEEKPKQEKTGTISFEGKKEEKIFPKKEFKKFPKKEFKSHVNEVEEDGKLGKKSKLKPFGKTRRRNFNFFEEEEKEVTFTRSTKIGKKKKEEKKAEDIVQKLTDRTGQTVVVSEVLSLKELSEKTGIPLPKLIAEFMKNGMMVNINTKVDFDSASIVAEAFDIFLQKDESTGLSVVDLMEGDISILFKEDDTSKLQARPPVVSIMGHVDHGKTSLLDYIRSSKVAAGEAGGITQSIGAYQVEQHGQKITFLDTPGHEAFTVMRARGAKSTDIAILVVAADEGVKPQTIESINHAKEAGIPVIVAINKMDKEGANPDHLKGQLAEHGLTPEDWGGDTPMVPVSAKTGFGIDDLLEIILLVAEMKELRANPDRAGVATVIESHLDSKFGPIATVLVNTGTLNKGDNIVCNESYGKVKVLRDHENKGVIKALPGDPVLIVGLDNVVSGGDVLQVVSTPQLAREKSIEYKDIMSNRKAVKATGLDILMSKIKAGSLKQLKIVVKADSNGSLEAIKSSLQKLSTPETTVQIIHSGVGNITEGDVLMCEGSSAILVGFGVKVVPSAKSAIEDTKIEFIDSNIIYHITERIEKIVTGMLDPKEVEITLGRAKVGAIFFTEKKFMIIGLVIKGEGDKIETGASLRIIRKDKLLGHGKIASLKQGVEEVKMLEGPIECGIKFEGNVKLEEGDELEIYKTQIEK
ncbi:MAG: translation initiation factor IF-2 [Candidatus Gracilibacteria bacterium]|nr:translation initiation factor IF-2 [Candidatus Gracilibacteria bacterium]